MSIPMPKFENRFDLSTIISIALTILMLAVLVGNREETLRSMRENDVGLVSTLKEIQVDQIRLKVDMADVRARLLSVEQRLTSMEGKK